MQEKWIRIYLPYGCDNAVIKTWVEENVRGRYHFKPGKFDTLDGWHGPPSIKFEDPADAVAFKLMWL